MFRLTARSERKLAPSQSKGPDSLSPSWLLGVYPPPVPSSGFLCGMDANLTESALDRQGCFGIMTKVLGATQRARHGKREGARAKSLPAGSRGNLTYATKTIIKPFEKGTRHDRPRKRMPNHCRAGCPIRRGFAFFSGIQNPGHQNDDENRLTFLARRSLPGSWPGAEPDAGDCRPRVQNSQQPRREEKETN